MENNNIHSVSQDMPRQLGERRKRKKDWVIIMITVLSVLGWVAAIVMLVLLERARPIDPNFFARHFNTPLSTTWNTSLLRVSLGILIGVFVICALGFLLNMTRHKRKSDKYRLSLLILGGISLVSILLFIGQFWGML